ncbi:MAG: hypothetical protein AB2L07_12840 [Thermoanaerobaculaceae bacterium]
MAWVARCWPCWRRRPTGAARWRQAAMVAHTLALATSPVAAIPAGAAFTDHFALLHVAVGLAARA